VTNALHWLCGSHQRNSHSGNTSRIPQDDGRPFRSCSVSSLASYIFHPAYLLFPAVVVTLQRLQKRRTTPQWQSSTLRGWKSSAYWNYSVGLSYSIIYSYYLPHVHYNIIDLIRNKPDLSLESRINLDLLKNHRKIM